MFHGFQMMNKDSRFPDELEALYNYKYEESNLNLKMKENHLLYSLSTRFDKKMFVEFLRKRKYRFNSFRYNYHYESCIEQIEGTANFVELYCLKQLSTELFKKALSAMRERVINPNNLFPVRAICYDIGALLLHIMKENAITFEEAFSSIPFTETIIRDVDEQIYVSEYNTKPLLNNFNAKSSEIIRNAIDKNILISDTLCDILGVNVYDAVFYENYIITRYFVMYGSDDNQQIEYGDFVIETNVYKKSTKIYRI